MKQETKKAAPSHLEDEQSYQTQYINEEWSHKWECVLAAQKEGMSWLFNLNLGGMAGMLAYASAVKVVPLGIIGALIAFFVGIVALIFFGWRYYRAEENVFYSFKADVNKFRNREISWGEFMEREHLRPSKYVDCERAAQISTLAAFVGIVSAAFAILMPG